MDRPVPSSIAGLTLTTDTGGRTSLAAMHGQIVVLADFMTLCQETCPLTTGNLLEMDRAVATAGLSSRVRFVELTVDPSRDTPIALAAYRRVIGAPPNVSLLTGSPSALKQIWRYFGVWFQKVAESDPPAISWRTGKPLTYDVAHQDALIYLDTAGRERFAIIGSPDAAGASIAPTLHAFLNDQGRVNLASPDASTWTPAQALTPIAWLTKHRIRGASR
jgi:protein SCO1/2